MRKFIVCQKLIGFFCGFSFDKHSSSHFTVGRFLFSTIIYILLIIFLWVKKLFKWTTVGWTFYSLPMKRKKMEGWPVIITGANVESK